MSSVETMRGDLPLGGNAAYAEVDLPDIADNQFTMKAFSQFNDGANGFIPKPEGDLSSWILKPQEATSKYIGGPHAYMRDMDTEFKILEDIAQKLGNNTAAKGQINLMSEKMVCPSCTDVISQFRELYPNIQLNVFTVVE